jgi:hypothetical protein
MPRKCRRNSKKKCYNKSRTIEQLYFHKYVPITTITPSVRRKYQGNILQQKRNEEKFFNGELFTC